MPTCWVISAIGSHLPRGSGCNKDSSLTGGIASLLAITEDGSTIEIGTVGSEGYIGAPILHLIGVTLSRISATADDGSANPGK